MWIQLTQCAIKWFQLTQCAVKWFQSTECVVMWIQLTQCLANWLQLTQCAVKWMYLALFAVRRIQLSHCCKMNPVTNQSGYEPLNLKNGSSVNSGSFDATDLGFCTGPQMIPGTQMIPDRKWSPNWTANDSDPEMVPDRDRKWSRLKNNEWRGW